MRLDLKTGKLIIDDYKNEHVFVKELQNAIAEKYKLSFLEPTIKDAISRLAVHNQFHSMKDEIERLKTNWKVEGEAKWKEEFQNRPPMDVLTKDVYKMVGSDLQKAVLKKWLMASIMRVWIPGLKFDLIPYFWSGKQGLTKTYSFAALFGSENVLEENLYVFGSKEQAEMTYHNVNCVLIDDPDYETTTGGKRFKATSTRRSWRVRFAYGRMEEMQTSRITFVIALTGNKKKILYDKENRRVIHMEILDEINVDLLLRLRAQIMGYIAREAEKAWVDARLRMRANAINVDEMLPWDVKVKDIMLDEPELRAAAEILQNDSKDDNPYEELVEDAILWECVTKEARDSSATYYLSADSIRQQLGINMGPSWYSARVRIAEALTDKIILSKDEWEELRKSWITTNKLAIEKYPEATGETRRENAWLDAHPTLSQDIVWTHKQIKRKGKPFKGYRIDFEGEPFKDGQNAKRPDWVKDVEILDFFRGKFGLISKKNMGM